MRKRYSVRTLTPTSVFSSIARPLRLAFLFLLTLGAFETSTSAPLFISVTPAEGVSNAKERYRELYDVIFPRGKGSPKGLILFRLTLRYTTPRGPDVQYEITKFEDGRAIVISMECRKGVLSYLRVNDPIEAISKAEFERMKETAKTIPVVRKEFALPADRLSQLMDTFNALSFPKLTESNPIYFDGTGYELWVQTGAEEISYSVTAESLGAQNFSLPMVRWMNLAHNLLAGNAAGKNPG